MKLTMPIVHYLNTEHLQYSICLSNIVRVLGAKAKPGANATLW